MHTTHAHVQVRSILGQVRPDRQTLLFSATLPLKVDRLVRDALTSPVRVTVGQDNAANEDIRQVLMTCSCRWSCCTIGVWRHMCAADSCAANSPNAACARAGQLCAILR